MSENMRENLNDTTPDDEITGADTSSDRLSTAVVDAVAQAADVEPAELGTSLYDHVDPDALDTIFSDRHNGMPRGSGHVTFNLLDYEVTVYSDGHVVVRE